jgi:cytochrome b
VGGTHAKFSNFICSPKTIIAYLKGTTDKPLGHNPTGALSVIAILAILITQSVTGLFSNDDIMTEGPLYALISKDTSDWLTHIHILNQYVIYGLIALHIGAILYYRLFKNEDLVRPMVTGRKQVSASIADFYTASVGNIYSAIATFTASAAFVWFLANYWK